MNHRSFTSTLPALLLVLACAFAAGCSMQAGPMAARQAPAAGGPVGGKAAPGGAPGDQLTSGERSFMASAAARVMYEMEVSRLAVERATSPRVRSYAQALAAHRAQAGNELAGLMRAKRVARASALPADKATKLHRLAALRPSPNFDLGYVRVVGVEDQTATIALFERARREAKDRDLKAWIDRMLPVLRSDLATAQSLAAGASS
jgi:putative membrane protein